MPSSLPSDPVSPSPRAASLRLVPIDRLSRNPDQPRSAMDPDALKSLSESIRLHGILSPILVRERVQGAGDLAHYVIIAGERRWRAAGMAGLTQVPVVVTNQGSGRRDSLVLALVENLQRADLNPVDEARGFRRLVDEFGLTQEEVARVAGRDRTTVANALRLLRLPGPVLEALEAGRLTTGHAKALLSLRDPGQVGSVARAVEERDLSVRATERWVRRLNDGDEAPAREVPPALRRAADLLTRSLGAPVEIRPSREGGQVVIRYGSDPELVALVERLRREP